jgi:hypothetical protein
MAIIHFVVYDTDFSYKRCNSITVLDALLDVFEVCLASCLGSLGRWRNRNLFEYQRLKETAEASSYEGKLYQINIHRISTLSRTIVVLWALWRWRPRSAFFCVGHSLTMHIRALSKPKYERIATQILRVSKTSCRNRNVRHQTVLANTHLGVSHLRDRLSPPLRSSEVSIGLVN